MAGLEAYLGRTTRLIYPAVLDGYLWRPDTDQEPLVGILDKPNDDANQYHEETWMRRPYEVKSEFVGKKVFELVSGKLELIAESGKLNTENS